MNRAERCTGLTLAEEIAGYAGDFELMRIGMRAGCVRKDPNERLERLWRFVHQVAPHAGTEVSELIVAHRRAVGTFMDLSLRMDVETAAVVDVTRSTHYAALASLCRRLAAPASTSNRGSL